MFGWFTKDPQVLTDWRQRMRSALKSYPIYDPPHRQGPNYPNLSRPENDDEYATSLREFAARGRENFSYFMDHRESRLAALRDFLAAFEVRMDTDDVGLAAVSAWCPGNCGALVADYRRHQRQQEFLQMLVPWTDERLGFNIIFDLGVFIGECIVMRNQKRRWEYHPGVSEDGSACHSGYDIIDLERKRYSLDPMYRMFNECIKAEDDLRRGRVGRFLRTGTLAGMVHGATTAALS